ncbi:MAG: sigma 54-interacting transcriptional regulator, partial [Rickettsiales bacterium]
MAALPKDLVESELFGHEKGAFTGAISRKPGKFEQAEGGTLFLDEIGDMPLEAQTRLLRALQEQEYTPVGGISPKRMNLRIACATHRDLAECVRDGTFREDLFFRLNVVPIYIPPLRERREDIKVLALHCLAKAHKKGLPEKKLSSGALEELELYSWPGNVRELENLIYRVAALHPEPRLDRVAMQEELQNLMGEGQKQPAQVEALGGTSLKSLVEAHLQRYFATHKGQLPTSGLYDRMLGAIEPPLLRITMDAVDGHQLKAAEVLGINRNTLRKKLRQYGLLAASAKEKRRNHDR